MRQKEHQNYLKGTTNIARLIHDQRVGCYKEAIYPNMPRYGFQLNSTYESRLSRLLVPGASIKVEAQPVKKLRDFSWRLL